MREYSLALGVQWMPDPLAGETAPIPFCGSKPVPNAPRSPEANHLADEDNSPMKNTNI
jgi:hypothetical protein